MHLLKISLWTTASTAAKGESSTNTSASDLYWAAAPDPAKDTCIQHFAILLVFKLTTDEDVVTDGHVLDPRLLRVIGYTAANKHFSTYFSVSPSTAEHNDDLPAPTAPVTTTRSPLQILTFTFVKTGESAFHPKLPLSTDTTTFSDCSESSRITFLTL
ncbi:unnamed protein product [Phytophthora lilii]|uniref:Unnamed protein product n=1 Tax=Phytophthora lilii TaxID=2077276 RepID=A0A9W6WQK7_9STRA|nr:unnamed protein product [Phytophthora lilii]